MIKRLNPKSIPIIICLLIVAYFVTNVSAFGLGGHISYYSLYVIRMLLWLFIGGLVLYYPRGRAEGLVRLKGMIIEVSFFMALFHILIYVLMGFFTSLGKTPYSRSFLGITLNLVEMLVILFGSELGRTFLLQNLPKKRRHIYVVLVSIAMAMFRISLSRITSISSGLKLMDFLTKIAFPELMQSYVASSMAVIAGPAPAMVYLGLIRSFEYLSPYLPTPEWMPLLLFNLLVPVLSLSVLRMLYLKEAAIREPMRESKGSAGWIVVSVVSVAIIWFAVGLFPIYPSVIITGSMEPVIMPGDVVLVEKVDSHSVRTGDIIMFDNGEGVYITHRIIEIIEDDNGRQFVTKGDNNASKDTNPSNESQFRGKIISIVPKIGLPSLFIRGGGEAPIT